MVLQSGNFKSQIVPDLLLTDLKRRKPLIAKVAAGQMSALLAQKAEQANHAGGYANRLYIPHLGGADNAIDAYQTASAYPSSVTDPDLSSAYAIPSDRVVQFDVNKVALATFSLPDMDMEVHAAGNLLQNQAILNAQDNIANQIEQSIIADMISATVFESTNSGGGTKFALDTTSSSSFLTDLSQLAAELNRQDVPEEGRCLLLNSTLAAVVIRMDGLASSDFMPGQGRESGLLGRVGGFDLIYSNNCGSTDAVAFSTVKYGMVMPDGVRVETLRDKDRIRNYTRLWSVFGHGSVSEPLSDSHFSGGALTFNGQRVGIVAATVS